MAYNEWGISMRQGRGKLGILTIIIAIAVISILGIKRINIGLAMLAGSLVLIIMAPISLPQVFSSAKSALTNPNTLVLIGSVLLIGVLSYILKNSGALEVTVASLLGLVGDSRWIMALVTSIFSTLVVPGGAMLAAPINDELGDRVGIGAEYKAGINIIFRHVWYVYLPIIPSLLTAASLAGVTPKALAAQNLPVLFVGVIAAWFTLLQPLPKQGKGKWSSRAFVGFLVSLMPLLIVIALYLICGLHFLVALAIGVLLALINLPEKGEGSLWSRVIGTFICRVKTMILPGIRWQLALAIAGVMFFKELLVSSGIINGFAENLVAMGVPMWLLVTLLPLFIGLATGFHEAATAIALSIFIPLLPGEIFLAGVALTFVAATVGYMLSPMHLCVILTREYYDAKFATTYRYLLPVPMIMLATGVIVALLRGV